MRTRAAVPAGPAGPVVAAILAAGSADEVLRSAFGEAQARGVALHVLIAGGAAATGAAEVRERLDRWAEKYPDVPCTVTARQVIDPAITLVAAARHGGLVVVADPMGAHDAAVLAAVTRRLRCPMSLV